MSENRVQAFFEGKFVPLEQAKVSVMTHAFLYGTAAFGGVRCYWNQEKGQLFGFRFEDHFRRLLSSAKILRMQIPYSVQDLCNITVDLLRRADFREDVYMRPVVYKSSEGIGVRLHGLKDDFFIVAQAFGDYIDIHKGLRVTVSSWRRPDDNMLPSRAKINGAYVNAALAKSDAVESGYDEAIFLTNDGHVAEGSAENLFIVRKGQLLTPPITDDVLEGITRDTLMVLARCELGMDVVERRIDRTELFLADEMFLCGTGAQVSPVVEVDHRPIGDGKVGEVALKLQKVFFDVVRGRNEQYKHWLTPIF